MKKLISTEAFQRVGATWPQEHFAVCKKHKFDSDDYLECIIRYMALTNYHPTSTCTMGRATDKNAVVDSELRLVYSLCFNNSGLTKLHMVFGGPSEKDITPY